MLEGKLLSSTVYTENKDVRKLSIAKIYQIYSQKVKFNGIKSNRLINIFLLENLNLAQKRNKTNK